MKNRLSGYFSYMSLWDEFVPQRVVRKPRGSLTDEDLEWPVQTRGRLKLATLWFGEVILQLPRDDPSFILSIVERGAELNQDTLRDLERSWVPVKKYDPDYKFIGDAWESGESQLVEVAGDVTVKETKSQHPELQEGDVGFAHEVAWAGAGLIDSVNLWFRLAKKTPCSFVPDSREQQVLEGLFRVSTEQEVFETFSQLLRCKLPSLAAMSWNRVVELRHSEFINRFREKMHEVHRRVTQGDKQGVEELTDEMRRADMEALVKLLKPAPVGTLVTGIASNLPLPIPINPISAVSSARQVLKEFEIRKKYGWLYFLFEVEEALH